MKPRRLLWLYCVVACLGLAGWLIAIIAGSGELRAASTSASKSLAEKIHAVDTQSDVVTRMEEEQRARRAELSPQDAIRYSAEVQAEQAILNAYIAQRDADQAVATQATKAYQRQMNTLIPIIGLLILHIVGTLLFWPRPENSPEI